MIKTPVYGTYSIVYRCFLSILKNAPLEFYRRVFSDFFGHTIQVGDVMLSKRESAQLTVGIFIFCMLFSLVTYGLYWLYGMVSLPDAGTVAGTSMPVQVILDAGHGGEDGGAVGAGGLVEKDLNLDIAQILYDMLTVCGVETVMTRDGDYLLCDVNDPALKGKHKVTDLKNRYEIAKVNDGALFISLHMNNFPVEKYSGLQVYYSVNNDASFSLAKQIQEQTAKLLQPDNDRKVKPAGSNIYLLDRIESPAVLVECGFLSNQAESGKLADKNYREQLALVIFDCIMANIE